MCLPLPMFASDRVNTRLMNFCRHQKKYIIDNFYQLFKNNF